MPREDPSLGLKQEQMLVQDDVKSLLRVTNSYVDSLRLKQQGAIKEGEYFGYLLNTRRVTKVGPQGKRTSISSLVVIGNGRGCAGLGVGKDLQPGVALYKATRNAKKELVYIDRFDDRTLFHAMDERFARTKLVIRLRRPGSGTRCSWSVWKMLSAFGVTDVSVKVHGSRNLTTVAYGLFNALQRMSTAQKVAERRGERVLDMHPSQIRVPGY